MTLQEEVQMTPGRAGQPAINSPGVGESSCGWLALEPAVYGALDETRCL